MPLTVTVRRGVELADDTPVTIELLRLLGLPVVTLEGSAGASSIADGSVTAAKLAANAVTEAKIATGAVTETKLGNSAVINTKIAAGAVTADKATPGAYFYAAGAHTAGVYAITLSPALASYVAGAALTFLPSATNTYGTGAVDLNVNVLGAKNLLKAGGQELSFGDLRTGTPAEVIYDGTQFILVSAPANAHPTPFATAAGTLTAYTLAFAATTFPVLGALYSGARIRCKFHVECGATPTLAVDGLTAKQIRSPGDVALPAGGILINTVYELIYDPAANSAAGAWLVTSGPLCSGQLTVPGVTDADDCLKWSHGLGRCPRNVRVVLVRTAEGYDERFEPIWDPGGYNYPSDFTITQGDEIDVTSLHVLIYAASGIYPAYQAFQVAASATQIRITRVWDGYDANNPTRNPRAQRYSSYASGYHIEEPLAYNAELSEQYALKVYYE